MSNTPGKKRQSLAHSFACACRGFARSFCSERNLKLQLAAMVLVLCFGQYKGLATERMCILVITCMVVTGLELMNTAVEHLVDLVCPKWNKLAEKAKDAAAAAVLFAAMLAVVVGYLIFWR